MLNNKLSELKKYLNLKNEDELEKLNLAFSYNQKLEGKKGKFYSNLYTDVALTLARDFHADFNTIIACLIHNYVKHASLEDEMTKLLFNKDVLEKTKLLNEFDNNDLLNNTYDNQVLLIKSIVSDVKITIIKLVERISLLKCIKNINIENIDSILNETLDFYVPISKTLGIYKIKNDLEDLCVGYDINYKNANKIKENINKEYKLIEKKLKEKIIENSHEIKDNMHFEVNSRSNYEIYAKAEDLDKKVKELNNKDDIKLSGFCSVKCLVDTRKQCYEALYIIHQFPHQIGTFNDYLSGTPDNEYKAIHTNVFINSCLVDFRICTKEMDKVNLYGLTSDWDKNFDLQGRLINNYVFYPMLLNLLATTSYDELMDKFNKEIIEEQLFNIESADEKKRKTLNLYRKDKK